MSDIHPQNWYETTLGNLAEYINGYAFKPDDWDTVGLPIIRIEQMKDPEADCDYYDKPIPSRYLIDTGDLIFSWSATLATLVWKRGPAILNQHLFKVVPTVDTDAHFLHHLLEFLMDDLAAETHGSTMQHIRRSYLLPFPVTVPPLPEQRRIAAILDALDAAIRHTDALIAKLKQIKAGLLHDLLTCGLDDNGELRDPVAHPEQFKESVVGRIPREWEVAALRSICEKVTDGAHMSVQTSPSGAIPFLYVSCIRDGCVWWDRAARITKQVYSQVSKGREPKSGLVLYTIVGSYGHAAVVEDDRLFSFQRHVGYVMPDISRIMPQFLAAWLNSLQARAYADKVALGNAQKTIILGALTSFPVVYPDLHEQKRIVEFLEAHDSRLRAEEAYRAKLALLKRGLMDDLLTGRVRTTGDGFTDER
ncbi:MAG: restriction endonuclease subunit S [Anaerolineae bacterium]|nr:restriction endonuclease subunit S [Anaerolineae bacterium]